MMALDLASKWADTGASQTKFICKTSKTASLPVVVGQIQSMFLLSRKGKVHQLFAFAI